LVEYRPQSFISLVGEVRLSRAYCHGAHCHQGHVPWEEPLRLSPQRLTPAAREVTALAGIPESFGKAADRTLRQLAGIAVCEAAAQRTTEAAGERLGQLLEQGTACGEQRPWAGHRDRSGKTCAYGSVDLTGIWMPGPPGAQVDGRMVEVGMAFNPQPRDPDGEALAQPGDGVRSLAGRYALEGLGKPLRRPAAQVGREGAEQWIALSEGGNGLEAFFDVSFPRAVKSPDLQPGAGHLAAWAAVVRPGPAGAKRVAAWCHRRKHAGAPSW
jgi:hypothetical protein